MPPVRGMIDIDGRSPESSFRDSAVRVGYVGAEPFLIAGSVRENLCYGLSRAIDDDEILWPSIARTSARWSRAGCRAVSRIPSLRTGQASPPDRSSDSVSRGPRPNRPHVLVLDEVSRRILGTRRPRAGDRRVAQGASRGRCTTILVSHRSAILKYADLVLELPSGLVAHVPHAPEGAALDPAS